MPDFGEYNGVASGVQFIECMDRSLQSNVLEVYEDLMTKSETQILSLTNTGNAGVDPINRDLHHANKAGRKTIEGKSYAVDDPIVYLENDWDKGRAPTPSIVISPVNSSLFKEKGVFLPK